MSALPARVRRALFLVPYIAQHPDGVRLRDLASLLATDPRTLRAELEALQTVGVPGGAMDEYVTLDFEGRGPATRVLASTTARLDRPPHVTSEEACALILGMDVVEGARVRPHTAALARVRKKLRRALHATAEGSLPSDEPGPVAVARPQLEREAVVETLERAVRERRLVELDYASMSSQRRKLVRLATYGLVDHGGSLYAIGKSRSHPGTALRLFKVERVLDAHLTTNRFARPRGFDLRKHVADRAWIPGAAAVPIRLRVRACLTVPADGPTRTSAAGPDGTVVVAFEGHAGGWVAAWVLRQGAAAQVLAPAALVARVAQLAARVAEAHEDAA